MTLLSDRDIKQSMGSRLNVSPTRADLFQPASIDVRLGKQFRVFDGARYGMPIDPKVEEPTLLIENPEGEPFRLMCNEFALGVTIETITLSEYIGARLEGKSSLGRLGLLTHATAGFIDPGFSGQITLELYNLTQRDLLLWPGMKIGQICFFDLSSHTTKPYGKANNHYQDQQGPTASQAHRQFEES